MLASLAELDVLPHVEVLSCVSGGSIIGAHYYLELRQLLADQARRPDRAEDYVDIVQRIERDFLAGVQRNIRTRVLAEWTTNLKMIFSAGYSRTSAGRRAVRARAVQPFPTANIKGRAGSGLAGFQVGLDAALV